MRIYITKDDVITKDENNLVNIKLKNGDNINSLEPRRLFPVSKPNEYISLLDKDLNEIALIRSLNDISEDSKQAINYSLSDYYLVPKILRIIEIVEKYGNIRWTVETDRGTKTFDIRNRNHDIRVYPNGQMRIRDSNDNRYTIDDWHNLDKHSKSLLMADL